MQGMNGEQGRDECAAPDSASHFPEDEKEQDDGNCMEKNVGEMVSTGLQPKELAIEHVRDGGKWNPIANVTLSKRRADSAQRQTADDFRPILYVGVIIVPNKLMIEGLAENNPDDCN